MNRYPSWIRLRIAALSGCTERSTASASSRLAQRPRELRLWLPLFLLWPLWLVALGFFVTVLLAMTIGTSVPFGTALAAGRELHCIAASLRGASCDIEATSGRHWSVSFY